MRLLVTRPCPDAKRQAGKLAALGHTALVEPLLRVEFIHETALPLEGAQALIATSRNALRALAARPQKDAARTLPLFAVGNATARMARRQGFAQVHEGGGAVESLARLIERACAPQDGVLVHLAGEKLAGDLKGDLEKRGFTLRQPLLYRVSAAQALSDTALQALEEHTLDGVILMSPATAQVYATLVIGHGRRDAAARLRHYCLSRAVADGLAPLALAAETIAVAAAPREDDLLALIGRQAAH